MVVAEVAAGGRMEMAGCRRDRITAGLHGHSQASSFWSPGFQLCFLGPRGPLRTPLVPVPSRPLLSRPVRNKNSRL